MRLTMSPHPTDPSWLVEYNLFGSQVQNEIQLTWASWTINIWISKLLSYNAIKLNYYYIRNSYDKIIFICLNLYKMKYIIMYLASLMFPSLSPAAIIRDVSEGWTERDWIANSDTFIGGIFISRLLSTWTNLNVNKIILNISITIEYWKWKYNTSVIEL